MLLTMVCWWFYWLAVAIAMPIVEDLKNVGTVDTSEIVRERLPRNYPDPYRVISMANTANTYVGLYNKLRQIERVLETGDRRKFKNVEKLFGNFVADRNLDISGSSTFTNIDNIHSCDEPVCKSTPRTMFPRKHLPGSSKRIFSKFNISKLLNKASGSPAQHEHTTGHDNYQQYIKCRRLPLISDNPVLVIASCPPDYVNETVRYYCSHIPTDKNSYGSHENDLTNVSTLPVADAQRNVFNNMFCAECQGVSEFWGWKFAFQCESDSLESLEEPRNITEILRDLGTGQCESRVISPYPINLEQCSDAAFRKEVRRQKKKRVKEKVPDSLEPLSFPVSFSILMNFGIDGKAHILFGQTHHIIVPTLDDSCPEGQIFDPRKRKCRPIVCEKGYVLKNNKCVDGTSRAESLIPNIDESIAINEIAQVVLEVNVSFGDYFLLFSKEFRQQMVSEIGHLLNMSESRIQNFSVEHLKGTGSGKPIQVLKLLNIGPGLHPFGIEEISSSKTWADYHEVSKIEILPTSPTTDQYEIYNHNQEALFKSILKTFTDSYGSREYGSSASNSEQENGDKSATTISIIESTGFKAEEDNSTNVTSPVGAEPSVVVKISFLLLPPSSKAREESSVDKAVQQMTDLVDDNLFRMTVNNTRISVVNIISDGEPLTMTSWCDKGVVNLYSDKDFRLGSILNRTTGNNETVIYVNETGDVYFPGQYDLMVFMEADLFRHKNPSVLGYVFVCTLPRILDKFCPKILLSADEYEMLDRDRVIVDIYTKTEKSIYEYSLTPWNNTVQICLPELADKSCGRIELSLSEFTLLENRSIIYSGEVYNIFQYQTISNDTVEICIPKNYFGDHLVPNSTDILTGCNAVQYLKLLSAEVYLTTVLSVVSIVSMAVVLLTYCLFVRLRNLPGVNTMNLTLALFIAEMIFVFGSNSRVEGICVAVAMSLHFFFLATFFWMNVMAYDVFRTFANSCVLTRVRSKGKYLPRYALYAWGCPALIVVVCAFIDHTGYFKHIRIGYGAKDSTGYLIPDSPEQSINFSDATNASSSHDNTHPLRQRLGCWIQEPMASLAAFGGPMLIILFANVIFYIKAIVKIRGTTRSSMKHTRRSSRAQQRISGQGDVIIYVRMSTVMGFTWIVGFTSPFISSFASGGSSVICLVLRILNILFTLLNCSQGFLIFFVFVANKRVVNLYKHLLLRKWRDMKLFLARHISRPSGVSEPNTLSHI